MHHHHEEGCGCAHDHKAGCCGHQHTHTEDCCGHQHTHTEDCCGHQHTHTEGCCGHQHTHTEDCGCGHEHTHGEGCGCGHSHETLSPGDSGLSEAQSDVLLAIHQRGYLPIARFVMRSSREENAYAVALEPVYIADPADDMETVKENGALFASLEDLDLVTLDYDMRLSGYEYQEYGQSRLYAYFVETVKQAAAEPGFVMDTPSLELGSVALTEKGREALQAMLDK